MQSLIRSFNSLTSFIHIYCRFSFRFICLRSIIRNFRSNLSVNMSQDTIFFRNSLNILPFVVNYFWTIMQAFVWCFNIISVFVNINCCFSFRNINFWSAIWNFMLNFNVDVSCDTVFLRLSMVILPFIFEYFRCIFSAFFSLFKFFAFVADIACHFKLRFICLWCFVWNLVSDSCINVS